MSGYITCPRRPFPDTVLPVTVYIARSDMILGISKENVTVNRIDRYTIRSGYLILRTVRNEVSGLSHPVTGIKNRIACLIVQRHIAPRVGDNVQVITVDSHIAVLQQFQFLHNFVSGRVDED